MEENIMNKIKELHNVFPAKVFVAAALLFSICVSCVKGVSDTKVYSAADLSGNWYAVVKDETGRWDYALSLSSQSNSEWTGTMTVTLDGKSPSTTDVSIESLGGGRMRFVWRPGKPNAQEFEGTYSKDKINVSGFGGQLAFTRR